MKFRLLAILMMLSSACSSVPPHVATSQTELNDPAYILVTVDLDRWANVRGAPSRLNTYGSSYSHSARANQVMTSLSNQYQLAKVERWPIKSLGVQCQVFAIEQHRATKLLDQLQRDTRIDAAQLMNEFKTHGSSDPYRKMQFNLDQLHVDEVHQSVTGQGVKVAIIDTHVDRHHPDLSRSILLQRVFTNDKQQAADTHGTAVAGIIGAQKDNGLGISGVAPGASILALTACWSVENAAGKCNSFTLAQAIDTALEKNADIINLSLGGPADPLLRRLVNVALKKNIIVIAANDPRRTALFPTDIPGVIGVAKNADTHDTLQAPGDEVLSTVPNGSYDFVTGNSFAAAHISGIAALALEARPQLIADEFASALLTAQRANPRNEGFVDTCAALSAIDAVNVKLNCVIEQYATKPTANSVR